MNRSTEAKEIKRRTILWVDDNEDLAEVMARLLQKRGHKVLIAHDGPMAIKVASEHAFDVAFIDIGLPGMTGDELAAALRQDHRGRTLVAVTGDQRALAPGPSGNRLDNTFRHRLLKPVRLEEIEQVLAEVEMG